MNTEAFITEILNRPPIWMSKHPQHKYKNVVKKLWEEIKRCFPDYEVEQLKKKWKNLKDGYRKELKKQPSSRSGDPGSDDGDTSSQWKYFSLMSFLKEEFMPAEGDSNLNENESQNLDVSSLSDLLSASPTTRASPPPREVLSTIQLETPQTSRKRNPNDIRCEYLEIEKKKLKLLEQEVAKKSSDIEKTDDYYFLMSLLPEMQKLTAIQKMRLRNKINQALMDEMAMGMLGNNSYTPRYYSQPPHYNNNDDGNQNR